MAELDTSQAPAQGTPRSRRRAALRLQKLGRTVRAVLAALGFVAVVIVLGHYVLAELARVKDSRKTVYDHAQLSPVYANFPDAAELWRATNEVEHTQQFETYVHWRPRPYASRYVNVNADGTRRTIKSPRPGAAKVFMLGGSTTFSAGSPDGQTIPSLLQKRLGPAYDVYNFGNFGYVAAQELNLLLKLLADGRVPQIVIFYDGVNDGSAGAYSPGVPRDPEGVRFEWAKWEQAKQAGPFEAAYRQSAYPRLARSLRRRLGWAGPNRWAAWDKQVAPHIDARAKQVVAYYEAHIRQVKALAKGYGFKAFFFWQPNLFAGKRKPFPFEQAIIDGQSPVLLKSQQLVYKYAKDAFSGREKEGVFFIGDVLSDFSESTFVDWCHPGPRGNGVIAARMCELLKGRF